MNKIPVKFLNFDDSSPEQGYWDMYFLEKIFSKEEFEIKKTFTNLDHYAIIVVPGSQNVNHIEDINKYIGQLDGVLLIICGDEEHKINPSDVKHPNMKLWTMNPDPTKTYTNVDHFIGEGFTPQTDEFLSKELSTRNLKWFFSGQNTHFQRNKCIEQLRTLEGGELNETYAFADGMSREEYIEKMSQSIAIPCPNGPTSPDTFRFYEALECGAVPIIIRSEYWHMLFGEKIPALEITEWKNLSQDVVNYIFDVYPKLNNEFFAFWIKYKRDFYNNLLNDFASISIFSYFHKGITVIIPTSPIRKHPDTSIIEETIASVRAQLPEVEIIITFDGVREEQKELNQQYQEYIQKMLWKINCEYVNVIPIVFNEHVHQTGMMREALRHVKTDKILYVEHDTPLTPDEVIDWTKCVNLLDENQADLIRFHFEAFIPKPHEELMIGDPATEKFPFLKTIQWSQRPHLTTVDFYKRILVDHFSHDAKSFIEDKMHGVVIDAYKREQMQGWNQYRLYIYHPIRNIKRSYHTDGRGDEQKYSMTF